MSAPRTGATTYTSRKVSAPPKLSPTSAGPKLRAGLKPAPVIGALVAGLLYFNLVIAPGKKGVGGAEPVG